MSDTEPQEPQQKTQPFADPEKLDEANRAHGKLSSFIAGFGIPANWAKVIAGAIIGAAVAFFAGIQTGCTAEYSQTADSLHFSGVVSAPQGK